jgi:hypothetical protein
MASIGPITLDPIQVVVANATVKVSYTVAFNAYDVASNQQYRMVCRLMGDDTPEGNADEAILNGNLTPLFFGQLIQSDGLASKTFTFTKTLAKANLDEDQPPEPNPDEIQAEVTLTPILPVAVSRQSNVRTLVA